MLVLTRHENQSIDIGGDVRITVVEIRRGKVRIGIEAPRHVRVVRDDAICKTPRIERKSEPDDGSPE